jgi:DNA-binding transcriptional regulator YiaG
MTRDQYRAALDKLGLTQAGGAELLGVNLRTSERWANGDRKVDPPAARFLRYLIKTRRSGSYAINKLEKR